MQTREISQNAHCGYVAIIGRPNVGKSTLLNALLQEEISITARKPQTTRQQILGILTRESTQAIFVDTPGLHQVEQKKLLNRQMNRAALQAFTDVDLILFLVIGEIWSDAEEWIYQQLKQAKSPVLLVVNKIDKLKDKTVLLPLIERLSLLENIAAVIPISAKRGTQLDGLWHEIAKRLPVGIHFFPNETRCTLDLSSRASEFVREQIIRHFAKELPYAVAVTVDEITKKNNVLHIRMIIWVEREGQKKIIIGQGGAGLKAVGSKARKKIERLYDSQVYLNLWVKVKVAWTNTPQALKQLGYRDADEK